MDNVLRKIESEEVIVYTDQEYSAEVLRKCREIHKNSVAEMKLNGDFDSDVWIGFSGVKKFHIDFTMDHVLYQSHIGKQFGISFATMKNMVKCYAIYCYGIYIFSTIAKKKVQVVTTFLQKYGDKDYRQSAEDITTIEEFLGFIGTPDKQIIAILSTIKTSASAKAGQRKLSPVINYLAVENEINSIYGDNCSDETFIQWFPIYFWVNVTFILPLRATEMLVTPRNCITRKNGKTYLAIRRTRLKKGARTVHYDVNKDYKIFTYEIPDTVVVRNIEKYISMTETQDRRFLFVYSDKAINGMLSLSVFNELLQRFMEEHIIGNSRYDFAKYATGIDEFEPITAGDSRPIAMSNLYFQKVGEDICRQLADHMKITTSSGYYMNISNTIWASSIFDLQRKLDFYNRYTEDQYNAGKQMLIDTDGSICASPKRELDKENLDDCVEQDHLEDCMGCKYYHPTKEAIDSFLEQQKEKADTSAKRVIEFMNNTMRLKNDGTTLEEVFLKVQTDAARYRIGCDIKVKEMYKEWQKLQNFPKTSC